MGMNNFTGSNNNGTNGGSTPPPNIPMGTTPTISGFNDEVDVHEYIINYNEEYKTADPTLFRDQVIEQTLAVLSGKYKPNPLLIGAAGTGKTKIVEDIARRIATKDPMIPVKLQNAVIYELPLTNLIAGTGIVGTMEKRLKAIIDFISDPKNNAILFIDEVHMLQNKRNGQYQEVAQILKPALARGKMRVIGATTLSESIQLNTDPAFNRRFSKVIVDELTREQTIEILKTLKMTFFTHYNNRVLIDDKTLETVAITADQFTSVGSHRPDNAITLLDRACGDAVLERKRLELKLQNNQVALKALQQQNLIPITEQQIKTTAHTIMTGHAQKNTLDMTELDNNLSVIKGQDEALKEIKHKIKSHDAGLYPRTKPLTMLFAGPSGVGKTEVTKIVAQTLTGMKPIILNMTEYHSSASINRIIGAPAGYVGSDSSTELPFDVLESNPYQIILLDEFEKCDKSVQKLFMSAFEEGQLRTNRGTIVDFSKAIVVMTTNAASIHKNANIGFGDNTNTKRSDEKLIKDLSNTFPVELLNRIELKLDFNSLDEDVYREIVANRYHKDIVRIKSEHRRITLPDIIPDADLDEIVKKTYLADFGARPAEAAVREYIESKVL